VLNAFLAQPGHMHGRAHDLREAAERGEFTALTDPAEDEDLSAPEGRLVFRRHVSRERDPDLGIQILAHRLDRWH
jgi:5-methylcytosine-specific restriction enzyme A